MLLVHHQLHPIASPDRVDPPVMVASSFRLLRHEVIKYSVPSTLQRLITDEAINFPGRALLTEPLDALHRYLQGHARKAKQKEALGKAFSKAFSKALPSRERSLTTSSHLGD